MINYIVRKIVYAFLVLWGVVTVVFFLFNVLPGDSSRMLMGQRTDLQSIEAIRTELGLNQSLTKRYFKYIDDLSVLSVYSKNRSSFFAFSKEKYHKSLPILETQNKLVILKWPYLQRSFQSKKEVTKILSETIFNTFLLALVSIAFASFIGVLLGILSAVYKDSILDRLILLFTSLGMSLPSFFAAILIAWIFAFLLSDYTHLNLTGNLYVLDDYGEHVHIAWRNLILPALTLGIRPLSVVLQLARNSMLDVLSQDYIRTAKAKGLSFYHILRKHALKNALNPVVTAVSGWLASMMAGVVFVEYIFGWKGLGYVIVEGVNNYDIPVVMGVVLFISLFFVLITLFVDLIYVLLDPRVKL